MDDRPAQPLGAHSRRGARRRLLHRSPAPPARPAPRRRPAACIHRTVAPCAPSTQRWPTTSPAPASGPPP